ncbi:tetratricopeptide repeat protein [Leptospira sp. 201903070]|uniref:Tetratricopeptide repeat protein n=1 Tax=Leptospira ainlahdjerensis TaxID=2810033 RepID=A0ABS2U5Y1_9LEPT|nr:tetratricopeptide repeat protein [Leptospira ainlahdjerensis]
MENSKRNPGQNRSKHSFFLNVRVKTSVFMRLNIRYVSFSFFLFSFLFCSSSEDMIWDARDSLSKGNTAEAMRLYELVLKKNPSHLEANRTLGMILADSGLALNSAAFYLEKAEMVLPGESSLLLYLLEIHLQEKDKDKVKGILEKFSKAKDKDMESYAFFLKDCILEKRKNPSEFNRFRNSGIPALLPPARRMFLKCELSLYSNSSL